MSCVGNSINLKNAIEVSELESFFLVIDKLLDKKLEENLKSGIVLNKGEQNELRVRYRNTQKTLKELSSYFGLKGCFSFGICGTCDSFNNSGYSCGHLGKCNGKEVHIYDTCNEHSTNGGGFGL